ncbi:MAG: ThiF family adenylyltransferase [Promethearchaeota archaeon]|nr:MAG: ThiF family adenylyltransferase [Candidatus Lokiarchaeota archaeon]
MKRKKDINKDYKVLGVESIDEDIYDRQKRIAGWDQNKISNATIMVVGAGATGNELIKNLVLTGIKKIILIDYDIIEKSNLNRCVLFNMECSIDNKYKVDVVKEACENLNPEVEIVAVNQDLNDIDKNLYKQSDVVCSCLDNIEARLQANNYTYYYGIPFIDSGIDGFFGSVQAVYSGVKNAACLQCAITGTDLNLMWKKFSCTGQEIKSENGETMGKIATIITTTAIIGGIQTQQVLKFVLGIDYFKEHGKWHPNIGEPLINKQLNYNGLTNKFDIIKKIKNPKCWICSSKYNKK